MFSTIKGKVIFCVAVVMVISTSVNLYFTKRDVGDAMLVAQENSARNILHSVDLVIRGEYQNLLREKRAMTMSKREQLKISSRMIKSVFKGFCDSPGNTDSIHDQIERAIVWLQSAPFKEIDYYIIDNDSDVLVSSSLDITTQTYQDIEDIKHRKIADAMRFETLKGKPRGDFAIFSNQNESGSVLAYFLPFFPWEITIGVSIDVSDIEAEALEKKKKIIQSINDYAEQLKITTNGFVYMVDDENTVLIQPPAYFKDQIKGLTAHLIQNTQSAAVTESNSDDVAKTTYILPAGKRQKMIVYSSYFKPLKWYTSVNVPLSEINKPAQMLVIRESLIITLMLMVGLAAVFILVTRIATPLNMLSLYAKKLPEYDFTVPLEDKSPIDDLPEKYRDEVGDLASSFLLMRKELSRNIQDLIKVTASRQAIESELNIAREIQLGMVPKTFPSFPEYEAFDLYATLKPAKEIGGDLYDFFLIDKDHICFTLGDVSDKGIPAALFMVVTRTLIRTLGESARSPANIMYNINNILSEDNPRSMFVTLVIGIMNINTGKIKYANGGHNPPIAISNDSGVYFIDVHKEPLVGAMPDMTYTDHILTLAPGESFFLYTDGVNEAMNSSNEQYSNERLLSDVTQHKDKSSDQVIEAILTGIEAHSGQAPQSDDIAMLMIKYNGLHP